MGEKERPLVLIVDDNADLRRTVARTLEKNCAVIEASCGPEALELLKTRRPLLMLLDIAMPGMDGIEVLKAARAIDAEVAVIMVTSENDIDTARRAIALGAKAYVTKPFDFDGLRSEVERLCGAAPGEDEPGDYRPWRVEP